jgi:RimJ/RimL family protein N-acetyltransferase
MITMLRELDRSDHDVVFEMMADPEAVRMAAFTAEDPTDRQAFDAQMERVLAVREARHWAVLDGDGAVVGTISTFPSDEGLPEVSYWIARKQWGRGHASRALELVLDQTGRPVLARVALDNLGSRRVLEKAGFTVTARNRDYAAGRHAPTDELILRLA